MGLNQSKIFSLNFKNIRIYFNNKFLGYGRRQYNQSKWHTLMSRLCTYFGYPMKGLQLICISAASKSYQANHQNDEIRILVNHGATHLFFTHDLFNTNTK